MEVQDCWIFHSKFVDTAEEGNDQENYLEFDSLREAEDHIEGAMMELRSLASKFTVHYEFVGMYGEVAMKVVCEELYLEIEMEIIKSTTLVH